jgi:hypothetical protein
MFIMGFQVGAAQSFDKHCSCHLHSSLLFSFRLFSKTATAMFVETLDLTNDAAQTRKLILYNNMQYNMNAEEV